MLKNELSDFVFKLVSYGLFFVTLIIAPNLAMDPINAPKMLALLPIGLTAGGLVLLNLFKKPRRKLPLTYVAVILFITVSLLVFFFSGAPYTQQLFGVTGRNTGLLSYIALSLFLLAAYEVASTKNLMKTPRLVLLVAGFSIFYGFLQSLNIDFFDWSNPYNRVFGFLGNPNFQSSLVGMFVAFVIALGLGTKKISKITFLYVAYIVLGFFVIYQTHSQQGFLVVAAGVVIPGFMYLRASGRKILVGSYLSLLFPATLMTILGMLKIGPLASVLYKESVTYRGDYWAAGLKMATQNPVFGVGFDSYGQWYRRARSVEATLRRGPEFTSNAAHNVYIDIFSNGGVILLASYLTFTCLTLAAIFKIVKNQTKYDPIVAAVIGIWVAYQAQSIISINQLGLAIWGWVISGLIIGYAFNSKNENEPQGPKAVKKSSISAEILMKSIGLFLVGIFLVLPTFIGSVNYKNALESSNQQTITDAAYKFPMEVSRMGEIAILLSQNQLDKDALQIAKDLTAKFPDSYEGWRLINSLSTSTPSEKKKAMIEMKRLDPNNPDLKK
jgi:O-antigen ligase